MYCLEVHSKCKVLNLWREPLSESTKHLQETKSNKRHHNVIYFKSQILNSTCRLSLLPHTETSTEWMNEWMGDRIPEASLHKGRQEILRLYEKWKSKQLEGRSHWSQLRNCQPQVARLLSMSSTFGFSLVVTDHGRRFQLRVLISEKLLYFHLNLGDWFPTKCKWKKSLKLYKVQWC